MLFNITYGLLLCFSYNLLLQGSLNSELIMCTRVPTWYFCQAYVFSKYRKTNTEEYWFSQNSLMSLLSIFQFIHLFICFLSPNFSLNIKCRLLSKFCKNLLHWILDLHPNKWSRSTWWKCHCNCINVIKL